jgi:hypothetical protein
MNGGERTFIDEGRRMYGQLAWHFAPFLSAAYFTDADLRDGFAMAVALKRADEYILPVLVGAVRVPEEMLPLYIGVLRAEQHSPDQLAKALPSKVVLTKGRRAARDFGAAVREAADATAPETR